MQAYELLETETGNLMSSHDSEAQALHAVAERARRFGPGSVTSVALVRVDDEDEDGEMVLVAAGADLLARAVASAPSTSSLPNRRQPVRVSDASGASVRSGQDT